MSPISSPLLRLLLVTRRDALTAFFGELTGIVVETDSPAAALDDARLDTFDVAAVDVAVEPDTAIALCQELRMRRPSLPVVAVLCCAESISPWQLETLLSDGVASVLDLEASRGEVARTLEAAVRGGFVLHVHLRRGQRRLLRQALAGHDVRRAGKIRVLELVARGLTDREIGSELHLSPHTVKHQVEDLRREVGTRNRAELAAWAGRHGFYRPESDDVVPIRVTQRAER